MNRLLIAHTPLGDALWAVSVAGREALSSLYQFHVRFHANDKNLDCQAMIGELCAIELETDRRGTRYLSGNMINFSAIGREGRYWVYEATVAPRLWHASRRADFRIWQNKTVPDIVSQVLGENAVRFDVRLKQTYKTWTYLTQHGDTDFEFICRQLEHEGIFFWFEHAAGGETMVLADHFTCHPSFPGYASVPFYAPDEARAEEDHFDAWRLTRQVEPGRFEHTDYDFTKPRTDLTTRFNDPRGHLFDQYQRFAYPGDYTELPNGNSYAANTLERLQTEQETVLLEGRVRGAAPGYLFSLTEHPRDDQNRELLITAAHYDITDNTYEGSDAAQSSSFRLSIEAMPANRPFRPPLATPKPRTRGPQTAVVVGPPGEEIHTDQYGRVKVHFFWDRYGKKDGTDTCWIRVAQPWAGSNFGAIHLPRIGQEVIVDFEHGDPDRPIITGRVYNAEQMPPWALPANKTQSGFLTRSSLGGSAANANAIRFEDLKGAEQLWIHAERNQDIEVELDETHWVGQDRTKTIDRDETTHVKRDRTETVDANETITVHKNRTETVDGNESVTVHKSRKKTIDQNETDRIGKKWSVNVGTIKTETIGMAYMQNVGLGRMENVGMGYSLNVGLAMNTVVGMSQSAQIGQNKSTTVGTQYSLNVGGGGGGAGGSGGGDPMIKSFTGAPVSGGGGGGGGGGSSITMDAESITLKVGQSTLVMKADGTVTLDGKDVAIGGSGHIGLDAPRIDLN